VKPGTGVSASLAAIVSSVATISCCLPIGFAAALGAGAASAFVTTLRPWLLSLSVVLLGFGFWQQYRAKQCAVRGRLRSRNRASQPDCCVKKGFHWAEVVLYAPHVRWSDGPTPVYWNGPVFRIAPALEKAFNEQP
jgi:hypothetical protein